MGIEDWLMFVYLTASLYCALISVYAIACHWGDEDPDLGDYHDE